MALNPYGSRDARCPGGVLPYQTNFRQPVIAMKHKTHNTIGPDAPLNSNPSALNSSG